MSDFRVTPFTGERITFDSPKTIDELLGALLADVGKEPVRINEVARNFETWEAYAAEVEARTGPGGFSLFSIVDHGAWIKKANIHKKVIRLVIGNPLIAITMLRHDLTAGLFAPVELLLVEQEGGGSSLIYVKPSSLMVVEKNDALAAAAAKLDEKLEALARKVALSG